MDIPKGQPMSPDIEDRRQGQGPTLADRVRDLMSKVRQDWEDSQAKKPVTLGDISNSSEPVPPVPPMGTDAADRIHAKIHQLLGGGDSDKLSADAAARVRAKANIGGDQ